MLLCFKIRMRYHQKFWPALIVPSPALTTPRPAANALPNKLEANVLNKIPTNPPFYSFASFWIVSLAPFITKTDSSRDLTIFMIYFISCVETISVIVPDP